VFERFTEQAHEVLDLARDEAEGLGHRYLGPEHLLLGILREGASGAARLLRTHGAQLEAAHAELLGLARQGVVPASRPSDRGVLQDLREPEGRARASRRHRRITAHVGLPDGYQGAAGPLLRALGVDLQELRRAAEAELDGAGL
jgi:ATP-dependent Clp protease ATP-binding subunit ClpA